MGFATYALKLCAIGRPISISYPECAGHLVLCSSNHWTCGQKLPLGAPSTDSVEDSALIAQLQHLVDKTPRFTLLRSSNPHEVDRVDESTPRAKVIHGSMFMD